MLDAAPTPNRAGASSFHVGLSGWHCRLTVDAPGQEAEIVSLFGGHAPMSADEAESEVFLTRREELWEMRWQHCGLPGDLTALLVSPEGRRFAPSAGSASQTYTDTVLGPERALAVSDGALHVLQSERWALYLEFVLTWLMMREANIVTLHAAVCAFKETALVLIGASGAGKSTLAAALTALGADFYGDETVFFRRGKRSFIVRSKQIGLRPGGLNLLPDSVQGTWGEAKPGDPKCTVDLPSPLRPCPQDKAQFYFLDGFADAPLLTPMSSRETIFRLLRGMGHGDPSLDARLDAAAEIAGHFPGWRLTLGRPDETAVLIAAHVRAAP